MTAGAADVREGMGTGISLEVFGPNAEEAMEAAWREAKRLESLFSRYLEGSDVWRLNRAAGGEPISVSRETFHVLRRALVFSRVSGGCFDATVAPLSDLWDFRRAVVPDGDAVARARRFVDWQSLSLYPLRRAARLMKPGQALDLGGIAKGYAGDALIALFRRRGVRSALINFGGGVSALGAKPDGTPWRVGIRHPREDGLIGAVKVNDGAVVTSGDYERCFFEGGRRYHHLIDPRAGVPADSGLVSVTIYAYRGLDADALSTAAFVAGLDSGLTLIRRVRGAGAVLIDRNLRVYVTGNLAARFERAGTLDFSLV